eukprot:CAMPEP_0173315300 /NCGR_PEP_ID=MMETSP1143-20121109/25827_1 /TAXON_ID=483371 /ORGANISM="non described non described, Strain CCMP2298" /LENGTH=80 /DNA_ID=CAMNT_0014258023 /DNA_START=731 /DNA_END=969 /DNA_ORIENTATION=+
MGSGCISRSCAVLPHVNRRPFESMEAEEWPLANTLWNTPPFTPISAPISTSVSVSAGSLTWASSTVAALGNSCVEVPPTP